MAKGNFPTCLQITLAYEGGFSNDAHDPGGATMWGIIQVEYDKYRRGKGEPTQTVRDISHDEMEEIYAANYWNPCQCEVWPQGNDLVVWDAAVNSGVTRSKQWAQNVLMTPAKAWLEMARIAQAQPDRTDFVKRFCAKRLSFLTALATWQFFGKGWGSRVANVEARGVKMVAQQMNPGAVTVTLANEAARAGKRARGHATATGGATGGSAAATQAIDWTHPIEIVAIACLLALAAYCGWYWWVHRQRAQAYAAVAMGG